MFENKEMIKVIGVLNNLQDKLVELGVTELVKELPQIAVVGSQSAGKSSVLESFVGRDFLPRGNDIVTRRPLILQLKNNKEDSRTFGKFSHSAKIFTDFDEISREIEAETERTVPDFDISADPINLMITSPDVLDLNLIDLPGMTKVPVGDQPDNIETIVRDLIYGFIKSENCIILAVTPANQDLSTSDAIKLAREVDPDGNRTIGVLTKLDLLDKGTDVQKILLNQHKIRIKRGFIGVVCRSPKDLENNKALSKAIADEKTFFAEHQSYKDMTDRQGIQYLQKYLQNELANHLFKELPTLRDKFEDNLNNLNERLEKISIEKMREKTANELISDTVRQFSKSFCNEIGTGDDVPIDRKNFGTNINVIMNVRYAEQLEAIVHDKKRIKKEIRIAIMNIFGTRIQSFAPNKAFEIVVRQQLELMKPASIKCVDSVYNELEAIVRNSSKDIGMFPNIIEMYTNTTLDFLRECREKCKQMVYHKLETEESYLSAIDSHVIKTIRIEKEKSNSKKSVTNGLTEDIPTEGYSTYGGHLYYFSIDSEFRKLNWYDDEDKGRLRGSFELKASKLSISENKSIQLKFRNNSEMKLVFDTNDSVVEWVSALIKTAYHDSDEKEGHIEEDEEEDPEDNKYPINIDSYIEQVRILVLAHIKQMERSLKETLPKLCQKELISATEMFVGETLRNLIQNKNLTVDQLIGEDPHQEERKSYLKRKEHLEDALKAMKDMMKSSVSLKA